MASEIISVEPATGAQVWRGTPDDVEQAVALAREARPRWARRPLAERLDIMRMFAEQVEAAAPQFAELIARETGKPLWEARTEVAAVAAKVEISITAQEERAGTRHLGQAGGAEAVLRHRPHGVMAVLGPYNFPAHLPNGHIIPALLAGNAVLFKPSEKTPAVGALLIDLLHQAGVPSEAAQLVIGGPDEGRALVAHRDVDGVLFTGSERAGIAINRMLADSPGKVLALEMGGNNPVVVWDTERLEDAAAIIVQSAFTTAGQRCTAARRLIVRDELADEVTGRVADLIGKMIIGAPFDEPQPFMGPVIDNDAALSLLAGWEQLVAAGGEAIVLLRRPNPELPFLTPGLIDMTSASTRPDDEMFGPLLQVTRVARFEEALHAANDTRFGLSASLVGGSSAHYDDFRTTIRAGIINWNRPTNGASSAAPFGGLGNSGNNRPAAYYAADYCAHPVVSSEAASPEATLATGFTHD